MNDNFFNLVARKGIIYLSPLIQNLLISILYSQFWQKSIYRNFSNDRFIYINWYLNSHYIWSHWTFVCNIYPCTKKYWGNLPSKSRRYQVDAWHKEVVAIRRCTLKEACQGYRGRCTWRTGAFRSRLVTSGIILLDPFDPSNYFLYEISFPPDQLRKLNESNIEHDHSKQTE